MDNDFATGYALGADSNNNGNNGGMFGGDCGWWAIILFAMIFGWGNGGWGGGFGNGANGASGALTRADLCQDMNFGQVENGVRAIQQGICDSTFALNNTVVNGFNGVQRDLCTGLASVNAGINENRFAGQQNACAIERAIDNSRFDTQAGLNSVSNQIASCCCETNRAIERGFCDVNYNMATNTNALQVSMANNTRDIIQSQESGTRAILDYLCNEKISSLQAENQNLKLQASQQAQNVLLTGAMVEQTNHLINRIAPYPIPSFNVPSPYNYSYGYGYGYNGYNNNGCGCNSGCGCC